MVRATAGVNSSRNSWSFYIASYEERTELTIKVPGEVARRDGGHYWE